MPKKSHFEGWGYSDTVKLLLKGSQANINLLLKELKHSFPSEDIDKIGNDTIEAFVDEKQIPLIKKMATLFKIKVAYKEGGRTDDMTIAKIILQQLGGQGKLVMMTGAYNFVAIKNGIAFKIKNRKVNYIKIVLNGKDLYDVTFSKIFGTSIKTVSEHKDVYFDELIPLFEKQTGMYLKLFKKGGFVSTENRDMVLSQLKKIHHHEIELRQSVKTSKDIEAWVLSKITRASTDLSDVTHYLDGKTEYADGGEISFTNEFKILKDDFQKRSDEPNRVYHTVEGMYNGNWFLAKTDNSFINGYGSDGINQGGIYYLRVWKGGNPVGRDKSTKGGHVSEDLIASYDNKWDYRSMKKADKEIVSEIVSLIDKNVTNVKQKLSSIKFEDGGALNDHQMLNE
jgi:hypothetical protein